MPVGFDVLGAAAEANLAIARPGHTVAVVNTAIVPTAEMVTSRVVVPGDAADSLERIASVTDADANLSLDAQDLAEALFADHMPTNMLLLGAAYQHGCLPLTAESVEAAIRLNGAAVEKTLAAFRWGRGVVVSAPGRASAVGLARATARRAGLSAWRPRRPDRPLRPPATRAPLAIDDPLWNRRCDGEEGRRLPAYDSGSGH